MAQKFTRSTLKLLFTFCGIWMFSSVNSFSQGGAVQYGFSMHTALYQRYINPDDGLDSRAVGSAILNLGVAPKIWIGAGLTNISIEGGVDIAPFAFSTDEFKGLGAVSFPVIAKINFKGLTTMESDGQFGLGIGGGLQWSKTELFGLTSGAKADGTVRDFYRTILGEISYGFGINGFALSGYARYGWDTDTKGSHWSFGLAYDFNLPMLNKHANPDF